MKTPQSKLTPGIETLVSKRSEWIEGTRIGLISHTAAVDSRGGYSADLLTTIPRSRLTCIFGPEHGYFGIAQAGRPVHSHKHRRLDVPIYSLYGSRRSPTPTMMKSFDVLVFDMQDIGARPYTYVATLRYALEAAERCGTRFIVADRPIPLPCVTDGPLPDPRHETFVASIPAPMQYGMTPGETAIWLKKRLHLKLELNVAKLSGYSRENPDWRPLPHWIPPSPAMISWETARCFTATVFGEAMPYLDYGRGTNLPFQVFSAPWMKPDEVLGKLEDMNIPGITFHLHPYVPSNGQKQAAPIEGIRLAVTDPVAFRPVFTSAAILHAIASIHGAKKVWQTIGVRSHFFDELYGCSNVRESLYGGETPARLAARWNRTATEFLRLREECLLY